MRKASKKNSQAGFSVIELIIVIMIVAILATLSLPSIQRNLQLFRLETGSGAISSFLTMARLEAIKRNREVKVEIDKTQMLVNIKSKNHRNEVVNVLERKYLPDDITFMQNTPDSVTFTSLGRNKTNSNTVISISLVGTNQRKQIKVSAVGEITTNN